MKAIHGFSEVVTMQVTATTKIIFQFQLAYLIVLHNCVHGLFTFPFDIKNVLSHYDIVVCSKNISEFQFNFQYEVQLAIQSTIIPIEMCSRQIFNMGNGQSPYTAPNFLIIIEVQDELELIFHIKQVSAILEKIRLLRKWNPVIVIKYDGLEEIREETIHSALKATNINIASLVYVYLSSGNFMYKLLGGISKPIIPSGKNMLYEIYSLKNITFVNKLTAIEFESQYVFPEQLARRSNFAGAVIRGASVPSSEYSLDTNYKPGSETVEFQGGFEVEEYWYLRDALNFSEEAVKSSGYISEGPNGTLTGLAFTVNADQADLSVSTAEFILYRVSGPDAISYLHPGFHTYVTAFFVQPPSSSVRDIFLQAFTVNVWLSIFATSILIVISMFIVNAINIFMQIDDISDQIMQQDSWLWIIATWAQQGWFMTPWTGSMRMIYFFGLESGFLCYEAFTASLVSILSVDIVPINSFQELLSSQFLLYCDKQVPSTKLFAKELEETSLTPQITNGDRVVEVGGIMKTILQSHSSIITVPDSFYPILKDSGYDHNFACTRLSKVSVSDSPLKSSMFVKMGSPLKNYLNTKILLMQERGIKHRIIKWYVVDTSVKCLDIAQLFKKSLGISDVFTAYIAVIIGLLLSMLIGTLEAFYFRCFGGT